MVHSFAVPQAAVSDGKPQQPPYVYKSLTRSRLLDLATGLTRVVLN